MPSTDNGALAAVRRKQPSVEWIAALFLFLATAALVVWQNSRLAVLWDLSYILENAHRISLGQLPYRDFPFPYAPLTFLIQAGLIKLTGHVFWHTTAYCAAVGGLATVVTWRIVRNVLRETIPHYRMLAFILCLPLAPLGIYSIFPHPFYDPDCTFAILISILCLQQVERRQNSILFPLLAGATLVIPLLVKQNTGLAYLSTAVLLIFSITIVRRLRQGPVRGYLTILAGTALTLAIVVFLIHLTVGLKNYWHWTIQFAAERRAPARAEMLGIYSEKTLILWLALIVAGVALLWFRRNRPLTNGLAVMLIAAPFMWPAIYLLRETDASERAERLVNLWPVLLVISLIVAVTRVRTRRGVALILPFVLIAAIHGAFMSQQLWGSTYAIWPLFIILLAITLAELHMITGTDGMWWARISTSLIVFSLLVAGGSYVRSHERLSYANLDEGELKRSRLPQLRGLAARGDWIPSFEELVQYTENKIPRGEGILLLPGEDLFYYTTGRQPQFPMLLFDHTVNPYSPEQILNLCRERNIRWVIVKQELQDEDDAVDQEKDRITETLEQDFEQVESLGNYDIYRRTEAEKDDEDDSD